jgi:hypothetical protein
MRHLKHLSAYVPNVVENSRGYRSQNILSSSAIALAKEDYFCKKSPIAKS